MYFRKSLIKTVFTAITAFLLNLNLNAQDVEATISVIHPKIQISNTQIFTSLQASMSQFINQRMWCQDKLTSIERFKITMLVDITRYELNSNEFQATIQIQSTRPVFGSTYSTVMFNQLDAEFNFQYQEFQAMEFQPTSNVYNLTGMLAFYVNIIIGMNYDTYAPEAGMPYYLKAREILNASQSISGWRPNDGQSLKNRFYLVDNLTSDRYLPIRKSLYSYHMNGLDMMYKDVEKGRDEIYKSLENFQELTRVFPNSMLLKVFFNAKYKELIEIFKGAPTAEQIKAIELLSKMDPANKAFYDKIKS